MKGILLSLVALMLLTDIHANPIKSVSVLNRQTVEVTDQDGQVMTLDFYGPNIVRLFLDPKGGILRAPEATPPAEILVRNARKETNVSIKENGGKAIVQAKDGISVEIDKATGLLTLYNKEGKAVVSQAAPVNFAKGGYDLRLNMKDNEYFYGGGVQNGRFSHRGERISIVNTNSWTDGGVCSPAPMYWSTAGYGVMCHTFKPGYYDFKGNVTIHHDEPYFDMFLWTGNCPVALLDGYYQLTGYPVLLPKFAFYEGHLNAYNRDYWKETEDTKRGILYEDGKYYTESQKAIEGGIRESLNGDVGDYQFSGRAVIDRYQKADMPLGWVLPNDGYGAGYGQTETLDGNIANLKAFGDYARERGIEIGLWTQSNLHPIDSIPALLQRDIVKEVRDAGVRVLKTDVAWVGAGYSFGLNGITDVAQIMPYYGNQARPFIISLDGWAGTQRYAGIWTGDQTGGEWEYIRFHIPTFVGAGLAGMSNITNDMDGIFGGKNLAVNIRDFQWKTFTPMQLNMDGWGSNPKYPQALGEPATSINRSYLKLKSMLLPYTYSYAHEAITRKPLIRAMFLDEATPYTLGKRTQYQFLYGPDMLVAPIYEDSEVRNGIYLPKGTWYDYFTGEAYEGGQVLNSFDAPLWKLPVFVREGAIIPMNNPNNNPSQIDQTLRIFEIYPATKLTSMDVYDDDGTTDDYLSGASLTQHIEQQTTKGKTIVTILPAQGKGYKGMTDKKKTCLIVNLNCSPKKVVTKVNGKTIQANWTYGQEPMMEKINIRRPKQLVINVPETSIYDKVEVVVQGEGLRVKDEGLRVKGVTGRPEGATLAVQEGLRVKDANLTTPLLSEEKSEESLSAYTLTPKWKAVDGANYYEMEFEGMRYTNIRQTEYTFDLLEPETEYQFRIRAVGTQGVSEWSDFTMRTEANPLEFAMKGITATCTVADQPGNGIRRLFDLDDKGEIWHTAWNQPNATPFTIDIDMHAITQLDRIQYIPRDNAGNGTLLSGTISMSHDGNVWSEPKAFRWQQNNKPKEIELSILDSELSTSEVRYIRMVVDKAVGGFGSGAELFVFRKPDAKVLIPGDINQDGKIDENDLTSYLNYTGLRKGDGDFDGYVSVGDVNGNGLIDAQDISYVATQLEDGAGRASGTLAGSVSLKYNTQNGKALKAKAGDEIIVTVVGNGLQAANALNLVMPYNQKQIEFIGVEPLAVSGMQNMTNNRLHTNGDRVLYPTFVNIGHGQEIQGENIELFRLRFRALSPMSITELPVSGMIVDRGLNAITF